MGKIVLSGNIPITSTHHIDPWDCTEYKTVSGTYLLSSTFGITSAQKWQMGKIVLSGNIPVTSAPAFLPGIYVEYNKRFFWNHNSPIITSCLAIESKMVPTISKHRADEELNNKLEEVCTSHRIVGNQSKPVILAIYLGKYLQVLICIVQGNWMI